MGRPTDDRKMWEAFVGKTREEYEKSLIEAYKRGEATKEQLIEEGVWNKIKPRINIKRKKTSG